MKGEKITMYHPIILLVLYLFIEYICNGSFHFRHYYIFFAILPLLLSKGSIDVENKKN